MACQLEWYSSADLCGIHGSSMYAEGMCEYMRLKQLEDYAASMSEMVVRVVGHESELAAVVDRVRALKFVPITTGDARTDDMLKVQALKDRATLMKAVGDE